MERNSSFNYGLTGSKLNSSELTRFENFQKFSSAPIIDLRSFQAFCLGHLAGASHFLVEELKSRMHELPKRDQALRLVGDSAAISEAKQFLLSKGYFIKDSLQWNSVLETYLANTNTLLDGNQSARLWSPASIVERFQREFASNYSKSYGKALDVACGSGRNSVYLASQGWQVTGVDYLPAAIEKLEKLAINNGVKVDGYTMDLEKQLTEFQYQTEKYDLILVIRYLHRPLLPVIKQKLNRGGFLIYQTFLQGCEAYGSPRNPNFLLKHGELSETFNDMDILLDEVETLNDGRPTNIFIAKNKS